MAWSVHAQGRAAKVMAAIADQMGAAQADDQEAAAMKIAAEALDAWLRAQDPNLPVQASASAQNGMAGFPHILSLSFTVHASPIPGFVE